MASRWKSFETRLPKLKLPVPWQAKVDQEKTIFEGKEHQVLARYLRQAKLEKEELESRIQAINIREEALEQLLLIWMEDTGTEKISLADGTLYRRREPYVRIADREALIRWVKANDHQDLLSVHYQTLNALVKERMLAGESDPDGIEIFLKTTVVLRKE